MELKFDPKNPVFKYITTQEEADTAIADLATAKVIGIDVESTGFDPYTKKLLLVQIGTAEISYIFDARKLKLDKMENFKDLLEDKTKIKLLQNAKFDYKMLKIHANVTLNNIFDTMLAEGVLKAGLNLSQGLGAIAERYLGEGVIDKSLQDSFEDLKTRVSEDQLKYAALDTLVLFPIFEQQTQLLKKENLIRVAKLEFATAPVVAEMELRGVFIDTKKWLKIIRDLEERRDKLAIEFQDAIRPYYKMQQNDLFGGQADSININSQVQLMDLFNNRIKLDLPSTSDGVLARVNNPIVKILRDYRGYEKLISTYGERLLQQINTKTHRIHPDFLQLRTATGRFACNRPNLQNIPRNSKEAPFRECFNPQPGNKLVVADYAQFEMRILAELSGDVKMRRAFDENLDMHSYTASLMFDKPYSDDFKKLYPDLRQISKPIGFGLMYGMGPQGLASQIYMQTGKDVSVGEAEDLINRYFASYPSVKKFLESTAKSAVQKGYSITPDGRKRWYRMPDKTDPDYNRLMSSIRREATNHPIQGTNADAIKYALVFVQEKLEQGKYDGGIIMTIHDEIVCEMKEDQAEEFAPILAKEMERAGELFLKTIPVVAEPFVGDVWEH